jgi:flagellar hook-basal body complex protein FliE
VKGRAFGKAKVEVEEEAEPRLAPEPEPTTLEIPAPAPGQVMERSIKPAAPQPSATTTIAPELRRVRLDEQASMAQIMDILGPKGSFKIKLHRDYPEVWADATGKMVKVNGMLKEYDEYIDESLISERHGGGKFTLRFMKQSDKGSWQFAGQRTLDIAGDPKLDGLNRTVPSMLPSAAPAPVAAESPQMVRDAFQFMKEEMHHARAAAAPPPAATGVDPTLKLLLDQMTAQLTSRDAEMSDLRRELAAARNVKPQEDPLKDKLLGNLLDGQSGHVEALRLRNESEIRQLKESAAQDLARAHDRFDRDRQFAEASHQREVEALKHSHEVSIASAKASYEMQITVLKSEVARLERDLSTIREEVRDLRARKEKTIIETVKEMDAIKEVLGVGGDDSEKSSIDKLVEVMSSPAAGEIVQGFFAKKQAATAPAPVPAQAVAAQPRIMKDATGQRFAVIPNAQGGQTVQPVTRKPKQIQTDSGAVIEAPVVDQELIQRVISYLETAFRNATAPDTVAMSARPMIPPPILDWIRQNHTEQANGVDLFLSKVAKLPGTSPLSTQLGKNWIRKVGVALIE